MAEEDSNASPAIERAMNNGWLPQDQWVEAGKDPDEWVDHREFNYRGELMGRISSQTKELKQLRSQTSEYAERTEKLSKALQALGEQNKRLALKRISEERSELRRIRAEAESEKDFDTVASVDEDLEALKESENQLNAGDTDAGTDTATAANAQPGGPTEEDMQTFHNWVKENPWYVSNPAAYNYAELVAKSMNKEGMTFEQVLDAVAETVTSVFKDEDSSSAAPSPKGVALEPSVNGSGGGRKRSGGYAARLSEEEREIASTFVKEGVFKNVEEYAKQYFEA